MHIAPRTVRFLRSLGHDVKRVDELLLPSAAGAAIVAAATRDERHILTRDLDFSAEVLPGLEKDLREGAIVTVQDGWVRVRRLPAR